MFKSLGQRLQNKKQKSVSLWNREFNIVSEGLDESQVSRFVEELMSKENGSQAPAEMIKALMERAVADAEKIVADIKAEAQNEAVKIIDNAKHDAEEIIKKEGLQIEKEADEILEILKKNTKDSDKEAGKRVRSFLLKVKNEIENEVRKEYKETHSRLLYSLLGTSEVTLKPIDIDEPDIEVSPESEGEVEPEAPVKTERAAEDVVEEKVEPEKEEKPVRKTKEQIKSEKEEEKRIKEEEKKAKDEEKRAEEEAKRIAKEQKKKEAEELKQAQKEQKLQQKSEQPSLIARINAFRDRLNEKLSQPIGSSGASQAPRPVRTQAQTPARQEEKDQAAAQTETAEIEEQESTSGDRSRELMNLIYAEDIPETPEQPEKEEEKARPEDKKAVDESASGGQVVVPEDEVKPAEEEKKAPDTGRVHESNKIEEPPAEILNQDEGILYSGDIEMSVEVPVNLVAVSKLYNYLQSTPDLKVLYTKGSWDKATTIMISIDKPMPIIDMISKIPGIKVTAMTSHSDSEIKGASASLLGTRKGEIIKISLILSEG
jgi:hypothetical protein